MAMGAGVGDVVLHGGRAGDHRGPEPRRGRPFSHRLRAGATPWLFLAPAGLYLALFFGAPVLQNVVMSLQDYTTSTFYTGEAPWVGLQNYEEVMGSPQFRTAISNTLIFTAVSIAGQFVIGLALALFFHARFPLSGYIRALMLLPWLLPLIVTSAVWKWLLDKDSGAINRILELLHVSSTGVPWLDSPSVALVAVIIVNIWIGIPFNLTIFYSGLQAIPEELYEAAALDGATGWKAFRNITWPLLRPVTGVVLVLGVVYTLKALDIILGLTNGGPANSTQTLATSSYNLSFTQFEFGQGAAVANILILISFAFALLYLRRSRRDGVDQ